MALFGSVIETESSHDLLAISAETGILIFWQGRRSSQTADSSRISERCPSGLRSTLGKRVCVYAYRGFESLPLRHIQF